MGQRPLSPEVRARLERLIAEGQGEPQGSPLTDPDPSTERGRRAVDAGTEDAWGPVSMEVGAVADSEPETPRRAVPVTRRFERRHLMVVVAVLLVGLVITGGWLIRAREVAAVNVEPIAEGTPVPTPAAATTPATTPPGPEPAAEIRVHVVGAVQQPGVVTLPSGARVGDAINRAGGLTDQARPGDLNLAAPVPDGAQIWIGDRDRPGGEIRPGATPDPTPADPSGGGPASAGPSGAGQGGGLVNLNTADVTQLEQLPGVGPVTAGDIIAWRTEHGRFEMVEQLQEVPGIGPKTYQKLAPLVTV